MSFSVQRRKSSSLLLSFVFMSAIVKALFKFAVFVGSPVFQYGQRLKVRRSRKHIEERNVTYAVNIGKCLKVADECVGGTGYVDHLLRSVFSYCGEHKFIHSGTGRIDQQGVVSAALYAVFGKEFSGIRVPESAGVADVVQNGVALCQFDRRRGYFTGAGAQSGDLFCRADGKYSNSAVEFAKFTAVPGGEQLDHLVYQQRRHRDIGLEKSCCRNCEFAEAAQCFRKQFIVGILPVGKTDHAVTFSYAQSDGAGLLFNGVSGEKAIDLLLCQQTLFYGDQGAVVGSDITGVALAVTVELHFVPGAETPG
jgi:hypothetical protein